MEQLDADQVCAQQVEPQEKKKTPKGRALKRIKYTRRFVNVTMTGGKRKVSFATAEKHIKPRPDPNKSR
ncbi:40S ribosomal protein S30 [Diplodia seriata]|uniref:40S ribosomal protein S30 n=1 Tax=Diplodia seriata TaxID=420778 RepID=A0ABR3CI22_9PEZI